MENKQNKYEPRIVRKISELWVPHNSGEIAFVSSLVGPATYRNAGKLILRNGQKVPTGDYTASLLHSAYCNDSVANEPEFKNVRRTMENGWLCVFNRDLWTSNGVYVLQDKEAIGISQPLNINDLEKMLKGGKEIGGIRFSQDGRARFAPKGSYIFGENTPEAFAKDGFIVASCGKEGAEKLGEVSAKFKTKPRIYGVEVQEGQTPEQRVSSIDRYSGWLNFGGMWGDLIGSYAFGVCK